MLVAAWGRAMYICSAMALAVLYTILKVATMNHTTVPYKMKLKWPEPSEPPEPRVLRRSGMRVFQGEPIAGEDHIFFLETSCALEDTPTPSDSPSGLRLTPRAACSLESVAAAHPERRVYLLHTCRVRTGLLAGDTVPAHVLAALALPNVFVWRVRYARLFAGSPLEDLVASGALADSKWPVAHASDLLRFVLLWKYGGTYIDLDMLMLRSLSEKRSFGCAEDDKLVASSVISTVWDFPGRLVALACVGEVQDFNPNKWDYNGPGAITRALRKVCDIHKVTEMSAKLCSGFHLLPTPAFFPVPWTDWHLLFTEEKAEDTMNLIRNSFAVHFWNYLSSSSVVNVSSQQPFAQVARRVCPRVVAIMGGTI